MAGIARTFTGRRGLPHLLAVSTSTGVPGADPPEEGGATAYWAARFKS
jgi:hypothetical protein